MDQAFLTIEMPDGTRFRWLIPRKYAWTLFLERWAQKPKPEPKEEVKEEQVEYVAPEFKLW